MKRGHTIQQNGNSQAFPYLHTASRHHGFGVELGLESDQAK
jgi:hypothetical protein